MTLHFYRICDVWHLKKCLKKYCAIYLGFSGEKNHTDDVDVSKTPKKRVYQRWYPGTKGVAA